MRCYQTHKHISSGYWGLVILIVVLYSIMCQVTPYYLDDWIFMGVWRDDVNGGHKFSFTTWWNFFQYIRGYDNGRIANIMSPISTLFSPLKEFFPYITGILLGFTLVKIQRNVSNKKSIFALSLTWAFMIIGLPWKDTLFVRDYALNYIWAGAITIFFLGLLRQNEKKEISYIRFIWTILVAIVAGGWHEGFAFSTICGLGLLVLMRKFKLSSQFYIVYTVYIVSAIVFYLSPGMLMRTGNAIHTPIRFPTLAVAIMPIFVGSLTIVNLLFKSGRKILAKALHTEIIVLCGGILISGYVIALSASAAFRSYYWPNLSAITISVFLICKWIHIHSIQKTLKNVIALLLVILSATQVILSIRWQYKYTVEWNKIMELLESSESGTVFYDSPNHELPPKYTLGIPHPKGWTNPWHMGLLAAYIIKPTLGVVPTDLKTVNIEDGTTIKGSSGIVVYKGHMLSKYTPQENTTRKVPHFRKLNFIGPDGNKISHQYIAIPFVTQKKDTLLYYTDL